jgi:hypothetical protein
MRENINDLSLRDAAYMFVDAIRNLIKDVKRHLITRKGRVPRTSVRVYLFSMKFELRTQKI